MTPVSSAEEVERVNRQVHDKLKEYHHRSAADAYFQSHPVSQMFTSQSLNTDDATLARDYMSIIFGGWDEKHRAEDNIQLAYNHSIKQYAENQITRDSILHQLKPSDFVEGQPATKDSLLETFAQQRQYHRGVIDSDAERFLKTRATHDLTFTTFYGKQVTDAGDSGRHHHLWHQPGHLQFRPDAKGMRLWWNISSRTYAPDGEGGENPLDPRVVYGEDQRVIPITDQPRQDAPAPVGTFNFNDVGSYAGKDVDRFPRVEDNPTFEGLFSDARQRKMV